MPPFCWFGGCWLIDVFFCRLACRYKAQLQKLRRTIKDRVIQLKILATSKANSSDIEEAKAALSAATNNIVASIAEAMSTMHAASLRNRFKKAVNTAVALSKAVKGFKGMMKKKK